MKFKLTFKTPDALFDAQQTELRKKLDFLDIDRNTVKNSVISEIEDELNTEIAKVTDLFIQWGEYVTIEFDSETKTANVVKIK